MQSDAYDTGYTLGKACAPLVFFLPALAGIIFTIVRLRRPTANVKCHLALILPLAAFLLVIVTVVVLDGGMTPVANCLAGGPFVLSMPASLGLAIWGLLEFRSNPGKYVEGKGPAIGSFVLVGLFGIAVVITMIVGLARGAGGFREARASAEENRTSSVPVVFENLGFSMRVNPPWAKADAAKLNPVATVAFLRTRPESYFIVIAERMDPGAGITNETLTAVVKSNLLNVDPSARFLQESPQILSGRTGVSLVADARVDKIDIVYRYWIHAGGSNAYQLIVWGPKSSRAAILSAAAKVFEGFEFLPERK